MKTINFIAAAIASVMVSVNANATTVNNTKANASVPQAVEIAQTNSRSMVQTFDNGNSYKYEYILDAEGRVVNRITSAWNEDKGTWSPLAAYSVVYTNDETVVSYAKYNKSTKTYSKDVQQTRFNAADYPVVFNVPECCK